MKKPPTSDLSKVDGFLPVSRCDRIRTCDLCVPNAALYQAEPRIDIYEALCCLSNRASLYYHKFFCLSRKILYFLIFLKFQTKPPKIYDIMNPEGFILEVPAELQMRRSRRRKEDIMNSDEFILEVPAELRMRRSRRRKEDIMNSDEFILEVPAELRMRRSRRRKEDIMNSDEFILEVPAELRMRRKQRKKRIYRIHNIT